MARMVLGGSCRASSLAMSPIAASATAEARTANAPGCERRAAGAQHDQHADEAQQDGGEPAVAERLAEEERSAHGREERRGEGDGRGLGHRHDGEAVEEAGEAQDLGRRRGRHGGPCRWVAKAARPAATSHGRHDQEPEQVAEEDEDEGAHLPRDDACQDGVDGDAGGGEQDEQGAA